MICNNGNNAPIHATNRRILISGGSIAGSTFAYWANRHGFDVTIVENAPTIRAGGYPIDLRAVAMDIAGRMGLGTALLKAHIASQLVTFVDGHGNETVSVNPEWIHGGVPGRDVEVPRGELVSLLVSLTQGNLPYRFNTSIVSLADVEEGVEVTFNNGEKDRFDIIVGADGIHSKTRALVFGDERKFAKSMGFCFAGFSVPNTFGLDRQAIVSNVPGRMVTLYAAGNKPKEVFVLLAFAHPYSLADEARNPAFQRELTTKAFAGAGWHVPRLLEAMATAEDFYFDCVEQMHMPRWTSGRVALVGDAGYAPSFLTGQGSSLAVTGAYVLASELARHSDHQAAFAAYEQKFRPFVELNQATVTEGIIGMIPSSVEQIENRTLALTKLAITPVAAGNTARHQHEAFDISQYEGNLL